MSSGKGEAVVFRLGGRRHGAGFPAVLTSDSTVCLGWGQARMEGEIADISRGGCLFVPQRRVLLPWNAVMEMSTDDVSGVPLIGLRYSEKGLHCRFMFKLDDCTFRSLTGAAF